MYNIDVRRKTHIKPKTAYAVIKDNKIDVMQIYKDKDVVLVEGEVLCEVIIIPK